MAGLRNLCKLYGGMTVQGVRYAYDYAADEPVKEADMPVGPDRWKASERAKASDWFALRSTGEKP